MKYRMIAMDLDGTAMRSSKELSEYNKKTFEEAIERGITIVPATGRTFNSLPKEIFTVRGLRYLVTSNGAFITDIIEDKILRANYLKPESLIEAINLARDHGIEIEVFCNGQAYDSLAAHEAVLNGERPNRNIEYIRTTRKPVKDLRAFIMDHRNNIENINFNFTSDEKRNEMKPLLEAIPDVSITSSLRHNLEVGGAGSTKREAILILLNKLGLDRSELMAFGDARNDIPMIELAGMGVAMGNAWEEVKEAADYVAEINEEDGVGRTIRRFALDDK